MPTSPFGVPTTNPTQQAAMQGLQQQGALGTAPVQDGQNPVAMHLFAAFRALIARGGQPEDIAAVQQFLDMLQQLGGGEGPQPGMMGAQPAPQGQGPPMMGGPPGQV